MSDREQIRDESIAPVGFEPKPSYVLKDDPNQVGVGIFESGISTLSTQEKLDIIDRDLSKLGSYVSDGGWSDTIPKEFLGARLSLPKVLVREVLTDRGYQGKSRKCRELCWLRG